MKPATSTHRLHYLHWPRAPHLAVPIGWNRVAPPLTLILLLTLLSWAGMRQLATPDVVPATAAQTEFSAERAIRDLDVIATTPHPVGSPANAAVRQYLVAQIRSLGLEPQIQTTSQAVAEGETWYRAGVVNNVIVQVPGTDSTGAIAIDGHYDSVSTSPGASDCGSCVVTALETLRAVTAGPALKNDLIFVFTDAEERHMLGAAAFNEQHSLARNVRLTLNFEAQGSSGPALLYVTSPDDNWLVSQFLKDAPRASAYSLISTISDLYSSGRFDSDLGWYTEQGSQGLGFIYVGNTPAYHTTRDDVAELNPGSIQQEGDYTLALVRHFGNLDLASMPSASGDSVFFTLIPGVVVHYADSWVLPLTGLITLLLAGLIVLGFRRGALSLGGMVVGLLTFIASVVAAVAIAELIWVAIRTLNRTYQVPLAGNDQGSLFLVALSFASLAVIATLHSLLGRRVRSLNLTSGALIGWTLLLWLLSLIIPGVSYLVTWPLLFGLLPLAWSLRSRKREGQPWLNIVVFGVAAVPAVLLLPGTMYQMAALLNRFEGAMGFPLLGLAMLFVAPVIALLVPHLQVLGGASRSRLRWALPSAAAILAMALIAVANLTAGYSDTHPRPDRLAYVLNADTSQAQWVSLDQNLDDWTRQFFPAGTHKSTFTRLEGTGQAFVTPAPATQLTPPEVSVISDATSGDTRTLDLRLSSPRGLTEMTTVVEAQGEILAASIDGRPIDLTAYGPARAGQLKLIYADVQPDGWRLSLTLRSTQPIQIQLEEASDGLPSLPGGTIPPRPADTMPAFEYPRDPTIVTRTVRL